MQDKEELSHGSVRTGGCSLPGSSAVKPGRSLVCVQPYLRVLKTSPKQQVEVGVG